METVYRLLQKAVGEDCVWEKESMARHTTFRVGGPADVLAAPRTAQAAADALRILRERQVPYYIIGNGSNLLVSDGGYRGVILQLYRNFSRIEADGEAISAQAGAMLSVIAKTALAHSLAGFAFASGIPGTLGGAVVMNAGAYGGEMKQVLESATVLTRENEIREIPTKELALGYRTSAVAEQGWIVLGARLKLKPGDPGEIRSRMEELKNQRVAKQPLEYPSAGSTFKRPEGYFAGKLIMDAGLRGVSVGDAQVSEKHCGFIVNRGGATASEILALIRLVQRRVKEASGVDLEPEVRLLGDFQEESALPGR